MKPDVKTVAVTRVDGGLIVLRVIEKEYNTDGSVRVSYDVTPEYVESLIAKYVADGHWKGDLAPASWEFVDNDYLNEDTDDTFRNAWKHEPGAKQPSHDMDKAKQIHRVYLRKARLAEFCRLDNDYRIADEAGDVEAKATIGAQRQAFRDVTDDPRIEAAQTIEELKALRLDALLPEVTKGEKYMDKMRISPSILVTDKTDGS